MADLELHIDASGLARLGRMIALAGKEAPAAIARAVNQTGRQTRTVMIRTLTKQTGLKRGTIVRALKPTTAWPSRQMSYVIRAAGGDVSLKYFGARETAQGVSAAPWGKRRTYVGAFTMGGRRPNRVKLNMGGHVFMRVGGKRVPIEKLHSGLFIPKEMIEGATEEAFETVSRRDLVARIDHELARVLGIG